MKDFKSSQQYALVDSLAGAVMLNLSDRYWTENVGTRTPVNSMGKYWDEEAAMPAGMNVDDLLN